MCRYRFRDYLWLACMVAIAFAVLWLVVWLAIGWHSWVAWVVIVVLTPVIAPALAFLDGALRTGRRGGTRWHADE